MRHKYHIGDQVIFIDNQFRPVVDEIIDIDARLNNDGLSIRYLLTNGLHFQETDLYPDQDAAKMFYTKPFTNHLTQFNEPALA